MLPLDFNSLGGWALTNPHNNMTVIHATTYVLGDEKALAFLEMDVKSPLVCDRRYEIISVVRDEKEAEYREDIGEVTPDDAVRLPMHSEPPLTRLR